MTLRDTAGFRRPRDRSPGGSTSGDLDARRACRTGALPRGWIAVAYERSASECPTRVGADSAGNVAVLTRYDVRPVGARLDVCVGQPTPVGWNPAGADEAPGDPNACPGAARAGEPTTRRIRRDY